MVYTKDKDRFSFDGQLHISTERIEETLSIAIDRNLDAVIFTNYGNTFNFDYLTNNKDEYGKSILNPKEWDIIRRTPSLLELLTEKGNIYLIKGEEVKTKQGHLLVWGIKEAIEDGINIEEALKQAYKQNSVAVFSHLLTKFFHGCGIEIFKEMYKKFQGQPLGLEQNGQIPKCISINEKVRELAENYEIACFGTSDIHGYYRQEHRKIGLRNYSSIDKKYIELENMAESLRKIMLNNYMEIQIHGKTNTLTETLLWNLASLMKNRGKKLADLKDGFIHSIRK